MTYLFFADDYLLFIKAALAECQKIKEILGWYEVLRVPTVQQYEKYLGLLLMLVELKKSALLKSRKGCGGGSKGGRKNFYHKQAKRFLSKPLFKLFQCILQVVSNSPKGYRDLENMV